MGFADTVDRQELGGEKRLRFRRPEELSHEERMDQIR